MYCILLTAATIRHPTIPLGGGTDDLTGKTNTKNVAVFFLLVVVVVIVKEKTCACVGRLRNGWTCTSRHTGLSGDLVRSVTFFTRRWHELRNINGTGDEIPSSAHSSSDQSFRGTAAHPGTGQNGFSTNTHISCKVHEPPAVDILFMKSLKNYPYSYTHTFVLLLRILTWTHQTNIYVCWYNHSNTKYPHIHTIYELTSTGQIGRRTYVFAYIVENKGCWLHMCCYHLICPDTYM